MNIDLGKIYSTALRWGSTYLLGRAISFVFFMFIMLCYVVWSSSQYYSKDRDALGIDTSTPSYVMKNRGCTMRYSEDGTLQEFKLDIGGNSAYCAQIPDAKNIIENHRENARGINRKGSVGWQALLIGLLFLVCFMGSTNSKSRTGIIGPVVAIWLATSPITFVAFYTDYTSVTTASSPNYNGNVMTVYQAKDGKWYTLPHTKLGKHLSGSVMTYAAIDF